MISGLKLVSRGGILEKNHADSVISHAVDAYLLDELPEEDRTRFEEHYFECATCAEAVEAGQALVMNIRPVAPPARVWWQHTAAVAAALLLVVSGGQQFVIAGLQAPHANTVILAREREKGTEKKTYTAKTPSATVELSLPTEVEFPFYLVKIAGERTHLSQVVPAPAKDSDRRLSVQVARTALSSGHFAVQIEGLASEDSKNGQMVDESYEFDLK